MFSTAYQSIGTISYKYVIQMDINAKGLNLFLHHIVIEYLL